ncbi:MAG: NAD-dependent epimerase/dehydratase family protein [Victivallaceae bacterium]|nr:NAD-dependent epimerase/dehydratase family protein [Victivallaceae bacterium]
MKRKFDFSGRKALVTGGAGFIGSHLVDRLLSCGSEVVVLDNFSTGFRENLADAMASPRFTLIEGDIRNVDVCGRAVDGVDFVFHEAALGSVPRSIAAPEESVSVNVSGFVNVLHSAVQAKVKRFVYASSSSVYGDGDVFPQKEGAEGRQLSPYAVSKRADELFADNFHRVYGIDVIGLRYFNVFGPRQNPNGPYAAVVPRFIGALMRGESPVIYGDGLQSRDFTYVDNVVEANLLAADCPSHDGMPRIFNVGCGGGSTVLDLLKLVMRSIARYRSGAADVGYSSRPAARGDLRRSMPDISLAMEVLGYAPLVDMASGIDRTVDCFVRSLK